MPRFGRFGTSPWRARAFRGDTDTTKDRRDEGDGNSDGIVLSLDMVGDGAYEADYVVTVSVGQNAQQMPLQVDTGSSDLWIASTSCSSSSCSGSGETLYNPSSSTSTGQQFVINYLSGAASGPIVWDKFVLGGYEVDSQALAAANTVISEPLQPSFSGVIGLALPLNSVIASTLGTTTSNAPDGAPFYSNLFSITPSSQSPSQPFLSLSLSRPGAPSDSAPGSGSPPATLGIGRHPSEIITSSDMLGSIRYSEISGEEAGDMWWRVEVIGLSVYVDGVRKDVQLGRGVNGGVNPVAVVDSGVARVLMTPTLASGVWGALGINPAADGNFYVPCTTPLNMTITLNNQTEIPLHPLDLTAYPQSPSSSPSSNSPTSNTDTTCVALLQQAPTLDSVTSPGDIVLGVPFLRSVYTVLAFQVPDALGIVPSGGARDVIDPRIGFLPLTNPQTALQEFQTVRVDGLPLSSSPSASGNTSLGGPSGSGGSGGPQADVSAEGGGGVSVGLEVLFGIVGFFVLCAGLFGVRWIVMRRKYGKNGPPATGSSKGFAARLFGAGRVNVNGNGSGNADGDVDADDEAGLAKREWEWEMEKRELKKKSLLSGKPQHGHGGGGACGGLVLDELGLVRTGSESEGTMTVRGSYTRSQNSKYGSGLGIGSGGGSGYVGGGEHDGDTIAEIGNGNGTAVDEIGVRQEDANAEANEATLTDINTNNNSRSPANLGTPAPTHTPNTGILIPLSPLSPYPAFPSSPASGSGVERNSYFAIQEEPVLTSQHQHPHHYHQQSNTSDSFFMGRPGEGGMGDEAAMLPLLDEEGRPATQTRARTISQPQNHHHHTHPTHHPYPPSPLHEYPPPHPNPSILPSHPPDHLPPSSIATLPSPTSASPSTPAIQHHHPLQHHPQISRIDDLMADNSELGMAGVGSGSRRRRGSHGVGGNETGAGASGEWLMSGHERGYSLSHLASPREMPAELPEDRSPQNAEHIERDHAHPPSAF